MKYIDFIVQTLLLLIVVVLMITSFFAEDVLSRALIWQLVLTLWQMSGSLLSVILKTTGHVAKRYHLVCVVIYLIYLWAAPSASIAQLTIPAWILIAFSYVVTCVKTFDRPRRKGSFLPNLSF